MNTTRFFKTTLSTSLLLVCGLVTAEEEPTEKLEDLTVTADLRSDMTVREIATSVAVIDEETIKQAGNQHFEEIMGLVPNLNWSGSTSRPRYFQIRGIGERSQYQGAPNPSVGFIIDDMDFTGIGGVATLFDMQQIEVLRGPQGTRYGANALAGMVYAQSKAPSQESAYHLETLWGDDGDMALGFSATGALEKNAAYRFSIHQSNANGFRYNDYYNIDDSNQKDELMARGKINWQASESWEMDFTLIVADIDNGFDVWTPENGFNTHIDDLGWDRQRSKGFSMRNTIDHGAFDLVSITSYTDSDISYFFDGDWGNDDYWGDQAPYDFTSLNDRERTHLTQEFRLVSNPDSRIFGGSTDWIVGLYFSSMEESNLFNGFYNGYVDRDLNSDFEAQSIAVFGQLDTHLSDKTVLTTGLRFEQRDAEYMDTDGLDLSPKDDMFGGQLSINHELNDNQNIYATLSRGYKAGGFNLSTSLAPEQRDYDPEYLWNMEVGMKAMLLDYRLNLNLAAFYSKREDMQVSTSYQVDPTDPLTYVFFTGNAAEGKNYGLEADWRYQINRIFSFHGALGLLKAEFSDYVTVDGDFTGRDQAHAPGYTYNLGMLYQGDTGFFARLDVNGSDEFYFSDSHDQTSKAYELVNVKAGYQADTWAVYAWGRNVFDQNYAVRGFYFGVVPPEWNDELYTHKGDPSHFGISAEIDF